MQPTNGTMSPLQRHDVPFQKLIGRSDGKPVSTFPEIALTCLAAISDGKPVSTFPEIALEHVAFIRIHAPYSNL